MSFLCTCSFLAKFVVSTVRRVLIVFLHCEAAVIGTFIVSRYSMYIEYLFPVVRNVIQKSSRLDSTKCEGTVYNSQ